MKISICVPVKGRPRWLRQLLLSILLQGHEDHEVVVQDADPSQPVMADDGLRRVAELLGPRFVYHAGLDRGIFHGANLALARATGDVLYFACDDDLLCPGALERVSKFFEADGFGGPLWCYGQTLSADVTGRTLGVDGVTTTYDELLGHNQLGQPSVFWNRQLMNLAGAFDLRWRHAADYDLWLRFWRYVEPTFLDQALGVHRHHDGQNTRVFAAQTEAEARRISQRHQAFGPLLQRVRNVLQWRWAYGGKPIFEGR